MSIRQTVGIGMIVAALVCGGGAAVIGTVRPVMTRPAFERVRDTCVIQDSGGTVRLYWIDGASGAGYDLTYQAAGSDDERSFFEAWGGAAVDDVECSGDSLLIRGHVVTDQWRRTELEWTLTAEEIERGPGIRCYGMECGERGSGWYALVCAVPAVGLFVLGVLVLALRTPGQQRAD